MTELSPAAQAVMDAMRRSFDHEPTRRALAAGVLRAVADQVVPEGSACMIRMPETDVGGNEAGGMLLTAEPNARIRCGIRAIAAELEGQPLPPTPNPHHHRPMLKPDRWIREQAAQGMIEPFVPELVRRIEGGESSDGSARLSIPALSYGTSSYGYDLRLSPKEFMIFRHVPGTVMNPKRFNPANLEPAQLHHDADGAYFILPAHSYGLGVALERLRVPPYITAICLGKSTYARLGIIANMTPAEAGWEGHLTLEFSNSSGADCRIYAGEGICQVLFFEGEPCKVSYADRAGKYQGQGESVVVARV